MTDNDKNGYVATAIIIIAAWFYFRKKPVADKKDGGGGAAGGGGIVTTILPSTGGGGTTVINDDGHTVQIINPPPANNGGGGTGTVKPPVLCDPPNIISAEIDNSNNLIVNWVPVSSDYYYSVIVQTSIDQVNWINNAGGLTAPRNMGPYINYNGGITNGSTVPLIYVRLIGVCKTGGNSEPGNIRSTSINTNAI